MICLYNTFLVLVFGHHFFEINIRMDFDLFEVVLLIAHLAHTLTLCALNTGVNLNSPQLNQFEEECVLLFR